MSLEKKQGKIVGILLGVIIVLVLVIVAGGFYFLGSRGQATSTKDQPSPTAPTNNEPVVCPQDVKKCPDGTHVGRVPPDCEFAPCPNDDVSSASAQSESEIEEGWKIYKNEKYGFKLSYPENYEALSDSEDLYGWPDALVLFYKGGQSYDLAVEVWDTEAEYKAKYDSGMFEPVVKEIGGKYITLVNQNKDPEVDEIIESFEEI